MRKRQASSTQALGAKPPMTEKPAKIARAGDEDAPASEHVGQPPAGDDEDAEDHGVSVDDPLHGGDVGVEIVLDGGKRDGERGEVVGDDENGDAHGDHAEDGCLAEAVVCSVPGT